MLYSNSRSRSFDDVVLCVTDTPEPVDPGCFTSFVARFMEWLGLRKKYDSMV